MMNYFAILILFLMIFSCSVHSQVRYNKDGSVIQEEKNGRTVVISMEGKTAYGTKIPVQREIIRKKDFIIELIYSPEHSDMPLRYEGKSNPVDRFFRELGNQWAGWLSGHGSHKGKLTVVFSNCRISKTGYCGRKKKNEIVITSYFNGNKVAEKSLPHYEIMDKKKVPLLAREAVNTLSPFRRP